MWFAALHAVSDLYCVKSFSLTLLFLELCLGRHAETLEILFFFQEVLVFATATAGSSEVTFRDVSTRRFKVSMDQCVSLGQEC
jgi:hypothetical protein